MRTFNKILGTVTLLMVLLAASLFTLNQDFAACKKARELIRTVVHQVGKKTAPIFFPEGN